MAIEIKSTDYGASLYRSEDGYPLFDKLERDDRIRLTLDRYDWSAGDYTYAEDDYTLYLTGTGEALWTWDGRDLAGYVAAPILRALFRRVVALD